MRKGCTAVIVAAGTAQRMCGIDKMMTKLRGVPLLLRTVRALAASEEITDIIIVTRKELVQKVRELCERDTKGLCAVVEGGSSRAESVLRGLKAVRTELVAIHDGARPLVTVRVMEEAIAAAAQYGAAAPAIRCMTRSRSRKTGLSRRRPTAARFLPCRRRRCFGRRQSGQHCGRLWRRTFR